MARQHSITGNHFTFTVACFIQASSILTYFLYPYTGHESWFVLIVCGGVSLALALVYAKLMDDYRDMGLFGMLKKAFGKHIGIALSALYVLYFIVLTAANLRFLSMLYMEAVLLKTPTNVVLVLSAAICLWAASYDANIATRHQPLFVVICFALLLGSLIMVRPDQNIENVLPLFVHTPREYAQSAHIILAIFLGETACLIYLTPHVSAPKRAMRKSWVIGFLLGIVTLVLISFQDITTLGELVKLFTLPYYETLRSIVLTPFFSHMEIFFIATMSMVFFNKVITLFFISIDSFRDLFKMPNKSRFALLVSAAIVFVSFTIFPTMPALLYYSTNTAIFLWTPFTLIFPLVLLVTLKIREMAEKRAVRSA